MPRRLLRRKNIRFILTSSPPVKRMLSSGTRISTTYPCSSMRPALCQIQSGAVSSFDVCSASICMPAGLTNMWYATWPARVESRLTATQSSFHELSRRVIVLRMRPGSSS